MTEREALELEDVRRACYAREGGYCATCGKPLDRMQFHLAHVIPQRKHWMRRYGKHVVHHPDNLRATCPTDSCNGAVSLGNNQHLCDLHAEAIKTKNIEEDVYGY